MSAGAAGRILIAGGGIAGLATAIALARAGRASVVLEKRGPGEEAGAGIQLGPNAVQALRKLGVADRIAPLATEPAAIHLRAGRDGRTLARMTLKPTMAATHGAPYWVVRRADLHAALLAAAREQPSIELHHGVQVADVVQNAEGARVTAAARGWNGAALIGADGLWSTVARSVRGAAGPRPTGRQAARALLDASDVEHVLTKDGASNDVGVWLGPEAHVVHYPVASGRLVNMVVVTAGGVPNEDWGTPTTGPDVAAGLTGWHAPLTTLIASHAGWQRWPLYEGPPGRPWVAGRIALVGDAAQPMLPFLAQGGAMALESAVTLADCLAAHPDTPSALGAYETARRPRVERVAAASARNGRLYHLSGLAGRLRDAALPRLPAHRLLAAYDWLYRG